MYSKRNVSFLTGSNNCSINSDRLLWLLSIGRRLIDLIGDLNAFRNCSKRGELSIEMRPGANQDKEVRRRTVWLIGASH
jgi:hypothetical protein